MSVYKIHKAKNYTVMCNTHLRELKMSLKAKGLLSVMLSLPDDWNYTIDGICSLCVESESAIKSALMELKTFGYLIVTKKMPNETKSGRIEYVYDIFEEPQKQGVEKQEGENLCVENPPLLNTNIQNTNILNTNNIIKEEESAHAVTLDNVIDSQKKCLRKPLREFVKMRKAIKKPLTTYGLSLLLGNLFKLANTDEEQVKIIEQSILNGWQGIFPLSKEHSERPQRRSVEKDATEFTQRKYSREELNSIFQYDDEVEL